jgi:hypothetical protein
MRKTIIYLVLLAVLGFGVYYFIFSNKNVFGTDEAGFTVEDTAAVYKIYMADKSGNTIKLERKENGWVVNDTFTAIQATVNTLLKTLKSQQAQYPVPEVNHNTVIKNLAAKGVKVEVYGKDGERIKTFYVGGQVGTIAGTYMLMEGAERPYVTQLPGFEGYVTPRYSTDMKDWRDRTVFNIAEADLKSVSVQYPDAPLNNFTLTRDNNGKISVLTDPALMSGYPFNQRRANVYVKFFEKVYSEGFLNGINNIDSAIAYAPKRCIVDVETRQGQKQHLEVYWMLVNKRSKNLTVPDPDVPNEYDADRYYAVMNNFKDTILIQRASFEKLFQPGYKFYRPDDEPKQLNNKDTIIANSVNIPAGN